MAEPGGGREGEAILLEALRQSGCPIPPEVQTYGDVATRPELLVEVTARSLWLISDGTVRLPAQLPAGIAARHRICTLMAQKVKEMGFSGECGYNQLLYPSEAFVRPFIVWLVEHLPRHEEEGGEEELGPLALLNRRIKAALEQWCAQPYLHPHQLAAHPQDGMGPQRRWPFRACALSLEAEAPLVTAQVAHPMHFAPSILEAASLEAARHAATLSLQEDSLSPLPSSDAHRQSLLTSLRDAMGHASEAHRRGREEGQGLKGLGELVREIEEEARGAGGLMKGSRFAHALDFGTEREAEEAALGKADKAWGRAASVGTQGDASEQEQEEDKARREQEEQARREEELQALRDSLEALVSEARAIERENGLVENAVRQVEEELSTMGTENQELEKEYNTKKRTLELLPNAAENLVKLKEICDASAKKLLQLAQEWERHRLPLIKAIRDARAAGDRRRERAAQLVEEIKQCRAEMPAMVSEIREREERARALEEEYARMNKTIHRGLYTRRILDIINSINKQKKGIDAVIQDIREVQKEINMANDTLARTDRIADEKIFKAANEASGPGGAKDPALVAAYRLLVELRQHFERVIEVVREVGSREKEAREVEARSKLLASRLASNEMHERIGQDLQQVRQENEALAAQLRAKHQQQQEST